jgi:drug/metabolite transporter (DMT)-like permease
MQNAGCGVQGFQKPGRSQSQAGDSARHANFISGTGPMPQHQLTDRQPIDRRALATMVVLCTIWGTQQAVIKSAAPAMSPILQLGVRSALAALGTLGVAKWRGELSAMTRETWIPGLLVGLFFGLEFVFAGEALRFTSASHVTVYLYCAPIMIAVGLGLTHRDERLRPAQWLGVGIAFAGVALTFLGRGDQRHYPAMQWGDALALAGAASWAITAIVLRGSRLANAPATITLFYQLVGAGMLASIVAMALGETRFHVTGQLAAMLTWQVLVVAFGSYLTWFSMLRRYSAARLGVLSFMTPVFGVSAGIMLMGDRIDAGFGVGAAMILGGICIANSGLPRWLRR